MATCVGPTLNTKSAHTHFLHSYLKHVINACCSKLLLFEGFSIMAEARVVQFCAIVGYIKSQPWDN